MLICIRRCVLLYDKFLRLCVIVDIDDCFTTYFILTPIFWIFQCAGSCLFYWKNYYNNLEINGNDTIEPHFRMLFVPFIPL